MSVLAGIDEAGLGPILGPLVISSSTFSIPHNLLEANLWQILRRSVGNKRKALAGRLLVADSKKAYHRSDGIRHLERTVLACLNCLGGKPSNLIELLEILCPDSIERLSNYPWHKDIASHNLAVNEADIGIASSVLKDNLNSNGIELLELRSCCLDVAYYNKMVGAVKNKASVLFTAVCGLIKSAWDNHPADELQILVDRQGGRMMYRTPLQRMFPEMELKILKETDTNSSYELTAGGRKMRVHFAVGADDRFLPVSLASMASKYLRELLVEGLNRYFVGQCAALKPTAGYWKDGLRFIEDLKKYVPHIQYDDNQMIRCR